MAITTPAYTTREIIKRALDQGEVAKNNRNIDRCIESASRTVEGICHRYFYPMTATKYFDWPNYQRAIPWRLWLDDTELISVTSMTSGGTNVPSTNFNLESNRVGPPYNRVEIIISTSSALSAGSTYQRSIAITGLWGYSNEELTSGSVIEALDASETSIDVDADTSVDVGVGSIIRVDSERMLVTDRSMLSTGITVGGSGLTNSKSDTSLTVSDGTQFAVDEILLIDSERVLVTDIAGNVLTIIRGFDGSTSAAHAAGVTIYAPRTLVVTRGALGTTAATHVINSTVMIWKVPAGVRHYATAHAIHTLMQEQTGWFRTMSASSIFGGTAKRAATVEALVDERDMVYIEYGRKARVRAI